MSCPHEVAQDMVYVVDADDARTVELLRRLSNPNRRMTTALITNRGSEWDEILRSSRHSALEKDAGRYSLPWPVRIG